MGKMQIHEGWELRNVKEQEWIGAQVSCNLLEWNFKKATTLER